MLGLAFDAAALTCDVARSAAGGLGHDDSLVTPVLVSLFSDARARPDDRLPAGAGADRRGWCGDALAEVAGDRLGSRLWLLDRELQTEETRRRAVHYAEEALAWLVADGWATAVEVQAAWAQRGWLSLTVTVRRADGTEATVAVPVRAGG